MALADNIPAQQYVKSAWRNKLDAGDREGHNRCIHYPRGADTLRKHYSCQKLIGVRGLTTVDTAHRLLSNRV